MAAGRSNENASGAGNLPRRVSSPPVKPQRMMPPSVTPQKLRADLIAKDKQIEALRKLVADLSPKRAGTTTSATAVSSPRRPAASGDNGAGMQKVEQAVVILRRHRWASASDHGYVQSVLDLLQSAIVASRQPRALPSQRRHSMSGTLGAEDVALEEFANVEQIINLEQQLQERTAALQIAREREREVEALVAQLGEACRTSEARASEFQAKHDSLQSILQKERRETVGLERRLRVAEDAKTSVLKSLAAAEDRLGHLQAQLMRAERASAKATASTIDVQVLAGKVSTLTGELAEARQENDALSHQVERLTKEVQRSAKLVVDKDETIRKMACAAHERAEAERETLLNDIAVANAAVSTLQLELRLNRVASGGNPDEDEDDDEDAPCPAMGATSDNLEWMKAFDQGGRPGSVLRSGPECRVAMEAVAPPCPDVSDVDEEEMDNDDDDDDEDLVEALASISRAVSNNSTMEGARLGSFTSSTMFLVRSWGSVVSRRRLPRDHTFL
ncbi:Uncharacterized protein PBTT_07076 [Plasmodiophora brassicae]|uniref:Uncharacterized protein n=1 Tax=Plasmodiophora brassicae TaxID=37360 RepID=A0A0G4J895_PLABS|nr:hypothetical protein PBRA_003324 [Plasmodiophora brassicae]SPQ99678.1 unnamed protein product [Plasmodiophora brassicae]